MSNLLGSFIEIKLIDNDSFLKIRETLSRIGIASKKDKILYQSCHILHKQGHYYITHFKEMFALDGKDTDFTSNDRGRRNAIALLLEDWGLLKILDKSIINDKEIIPINQIKILSYKEKIDWELKAKYSIGNTK